MAYTRTVAALMSDVRIRADIVSHQDRHPDSQLLRMVEESYGALRRLLSDAGSERYVISRDIAPWGWTPTEEIPGWWSFPCLVQILSGTTGPEPSQHWDSIRAVARTDGPAPRNLERIMASEAARLSADMDQFPQYALHWYITGTRWGAPDSTGADEYSQLIMVGPCTTPPSSLIVTGVAGQEPSAGTYEGQWSTSTALDLDQYGFEWMIQDVVLKVQQRDNDAQERTQITLAMRQDAEQRLLSTLSRERSPSAQRGLVAACRRNVRPWR